MEIERTIYNPRLLPPDGYTAECKDFEGCFHKKHFKKGEEEAMRDWMLDIWKNQENPFFPVFSPIYIYFDIDWDADHILYAKYKRVS